MADIELLGLLKNFVTQNPGKTASMIAKSLGVTRKEINSLLYKGNKSTFTRIDHGEKAPTWQIYNPNIKLNSHESFSKLPPMSESPGKAAITKVLESIDSSFANKNSLKSSLGDVQFEVILLAEGANSDYCRFEILEVDDLIVIINEDHNLNRAVNDRSRIEIALHLFHCISDCLTQYKMKRTYVQEDEFIPIKTEYFRMFLSLELKV